MSDSSTLLDTWAGWLQVKVEQHVLERILDQSHLGTDYNIELVTFGGTTVGGFRLGGGCFGDVYQGIVFSLAQANDACPG